MVSYKSITSIVAVRAVAHIINTFSRFLVWNIRGIAPTGLPQATVAGIA